ncbi:hypothetical protein [Tibeticola sp.]|uniref:hypothetical protein n=1 Tax=Tibeticola sp. TaxID=2005368 RepID=UPI0025F17E6B|nr:hypothetical protein [Tibeticola sp.]
MGTWVSEGLMRSKVVPPPVLDEAAQQVRRKRVRRTVAILVAIALVFYLILFVQIIIARMQ